MQDLIRDLARDGMYRRRLACLKCILASLRCDIPDDAIDLVILKLVKDTITGDQSIVQILGAVYFMCDLRFTGHDSF